MLDKKIKIKSGRNRSACTPLLLSPIILCLWLSKKKKKKKRTRFGIDWEKREFGPRREKDGERAGKRMRGRFWNKRKVENKSRRWRYMGIRVWWEKNKRKKNII